MDATQRSKTCFFGTEPLQDSYFVVEDMGVTFGVRLGGVDRVALYGHMLRSRNCSYIFPFLWQPKIWHVLKLYGKGVADGHGECGELCAAFIRLVQSWLGCRETRGYKKQNKKNSHQTANKFRSITAFMFRSISPNTACAIETFRRRHRAATTSAHFGPSTKHLRHEKRLRFAEGDIYSNNGFVLRNAQIL